MKNSENSRFQLVSSLLAATLWVAAILCLAEGLFLLAIATFAVGAWMVVDGGVYEGQSQRWVVKALRLDKAAAFCRRIWNRVRGNVCTFFSFDA